MSFRRSRKSAPALARAIVATSALAALSPAIAQTADSTAGSGAAQTEAKPAVPLPPVVVETENAPPAPTNKPKPKSKPATASKSSGVKQKPKAAANPVQEPVAASAAQFEEASPADGAANETALGPVKGYNARTSATATKTDTPILETPQAVSVISQDQIADQQARTVADALRYTPGITVDGFGTNVFFDSIKVRGFTAPQYLDGLRLPSDLVSFAVPRMENYGLERLEVLKGPSSGLYGQSEPGGLINMVSKRPTDTPIFEALATTGSFNRLEGGFDAGGPIASNPNLLYRVVGLVRDSDTEIDFQEDNKIFIAPSATVRFSADTSLTLLSQYQKIENDGYQQYVPGEATLHTTPLGRLSRSTYLGEPSFDQYTLDQWSVGYEFAHRIAPGLQFRQNLRYFDISQDMDAMRGDFLVGSFFFRTPIAVDASASNLAVDSQLQADFNTGILSHKLLAGVDYQDTKSSNRSLLAGSPLLYSPIDIFNPVYGGPIAPIGALTAFIDSDAHQKQTGIYVQDQIKLDRWTLSLSGRQDWASSSVDSLGFLPLPGHYENDDSARTGRVGLSYLFDFGLAPYASYSTSFTPNVGVDAILLSPFKPTTGEGKEIGIKFMPNGTNLMFTASLFDIRQQDILTPVGLSYVQTDEARVRGFEFEVRGNVTRELEIVGGYSKLDPEVTKSSAGGAGKYMPNINLDQASLWAKYTWYDGPLAGFGVGAGVRYLGENYGDLANSIYIPSHTLFDASVSYDMAYIDPKLQGWNAQINGTNLEDEYYVASCQSALAYCGLGAGRAVLGTLKYTWK